MKNKKECEYSYYKYDDTLENNITSKQLKNKLLRIISCILVESIVLTSIPAYSTRKQMLNIKNYITYNQTKQNNSYLELIKEKIYSSQYLTNEQKDLFYNEDYFNMIMPYIIENPANFVELIYERLDNICININENSDDIYGNKYNKYNPNCIEVDSNYEDNDYALEYLFLNLTEFSNKNDFITRLFNLTMSKEISNNENYSYSDYRTEFYKLYSIVEKEAILEYLFNSNEKPLYEELSKYLSQESINKLKKIISNNDHNALYDADVYIESAFINKYGISDLNHELSDKLGIGFCNTIQFINNEKNYIDDCYEISLEDAYNNGYIYFEKIVNEHDPSYNEENYSFYGYEIIDSRSYFSSQNGYPTNRGSNTPQVSNLGNEVTIWNSEYISRRNDDNVIETYTLEEAIEKTLVKRLNYSLERIDYEEYLKIYNSEVDQIGFHRNSLIIKVEDNYKDMVTSSLYKAVIHKKYYLPENIEDSIKILTETLNMNQNHYEDIATTKDELVELGYSSYYISIPNEDKSKYPNERLFEDARETKKIILKNGAYYKYINNHKYICKKENGKEIIYENEEAYELGLIEEQYPCFLTGTKEELEKDYPNKEIKSIVTLTEKEINVYIYTDDNGNYFIKKYNRLALPNELINKNQNVILERRLN